MAAAPPIIAASLWPDPKVERSIFGTADPEAIWEQVRETCPDALGCFAFRGLEVLLLPAGGAWASKVPKPAGSGSRTSRP